MKCIPFYSPVFICTEDPVDWEQTPVDFVTNEMVDAINKRIFEEGFDSYSSKDFKAKGLAAYSNNPKILSIKNRVLFSINNEVVCETLVFTPDDFDITKENLKAISKEISDQYSDGWGENFEQNPFNFDRVYHYVHFWAPDAWRIVPSPNVNEYIKHMHEKEEYFYE